MNLWKSEAQTSISLDFTASSARKTCFVSRWSDENTLHCCKKSRELLKMQSKCSSVSMAAEQASSAARKQLIGCDGKKFSANAYWRTSRCALQLNQPMPFINSAIHSKFSVCRHQAVRFPLKLPPCAINQLCLSFSRRFGSSLLVHNLLNPSPDARQLLTVMRRSLRAIASLSMNR